MGRMEIPDQSVSQIPNWSNNPSTQPKFALNPLQFFGQRTHFFKTGKFQARDQTSYERVFEKVADHFQCFALN